MAYFPSNLDNNMNPPKAKKIVDKLKAGTICLLDEMESKVRSYNENIMN